MNIARLILPFTENRTDLRLELIKAPYVSMRMLVMPSSMTMLLIQSKSIMILFIAPKLMMLLMLLPPSLSNKKYISII